MEGALCTALSNLVQVSGPFLLPPPLLFDRYKGAVLDMVEDFLRISNTNELPWVQQNSHAYRESGQEVRLLSFHCSRTNKTIYAMKVTGVLSVPKDDAIRIITDLQRRRSWDSSLLSVFTLETLTANTDVLYMIYHGLAVTCLRTVLDLAERNTSCIITATLHGDLAAELDYPDLVEHQLNGDYFSDMVKRGSGFVVTEVDSQRSELSYILQLEEGPLVDEVTKKK